MVGTQKLEKMLSAFNAYIDENPQLRKLVIGGYHLNKTNIKLADKINSRLNTTLNRKKIPDFEYLVYTEDFVIDSKTLLNTHHLFADFAALWYPIIHNLITMCGNNNIEAFKQIPFPQKDYSGLDDFILEKWLTDIHKLSKECSKYLQEIRLELEKTGITAINAAHLREAAPEEIKQIVDNYLLCPVLGRDIGKVEAVENPAAKQKFEVVQQQLQARKGKPVFVPTWQNIIEAPINKKWRQSEYDFFQQQAKEYVDLRYPDVQSLWVWHGTTKTAFKSILETGYVNLATTDDGFFGDGVYNTLEPEYAYRVYANEDRGELLVNKIIYFSLYPQTKYEPAQTKAEYKKCDAHGIWVSPRNPILANEVNYDACEIGDIPAYSEIIVGEAQCLLSFRVQLQPVFPKQIYAETDYAVAKRSENQKKPLVALYYFLKAEKQGHPGAKKEKEKLLLQHPEYKNVFKP